MWKWMLVVPCVAIACIAPDVVMCEDGIACPVNDRCDEVHHGCVAAEQFTVCVGAADGADCTAGPVSGGCFGGVCLPRGCGNRVIEAGEMCDDGNQISGDGCSGDCRSTEICGNGVVDREEQCDDGNLMSRDGCDSHCEPETAAWSFIPIAPDAINRRATAYDAERGRLVSLVGKDHTWQWDGARWTVSQAAILPIGVYYNPELERVEMVGFDLGMAVHVYWWGDGRWSQIGSEDGSQDMALFAATYDVAHHRTIALGQSWTDEGATTSVWAADATGAWTQLPGFAGEPGDAVIAYDPASTQIIVETAGGEEWVHAGDAAGWSVSPNRFSPDVTMAFDPGLGHLVLVDNQSAVMYERLDSEWRTIPDGEVPCREGTESRPLYYNPASAALELFASDGSELCRWTGTWNAQTLGPSTRLVGAVYDPATRDFAFLHNARPDDPDAPIDTWIMTAANWQRVPTAHAPSKRKFAQSIYSPGRAAAVLYGGQTPYSCEQDCDLLTDTWSFDGVDWTAIAAPSGIGIGIDARLAYDPVHRRVVLASFSDLWALADTGDSWLPLETAPFQSHSVNGLGWHARDASLLASMSIRHVGSPLYELRGDSWVAVDLVPAFLDPVATMLLGDERTGGVIVVDTGSGLGWERIGSAWQSLPDGPGQLLPLWSAYDPVDGRVLIVGDGFGGKIATILTRTSATPLESCTPGEDIDGDGLAGCDDPDCYWACGRDLPYTVPAAP